MKKGDGPKLPFDLPDRETVNRIRDEVLDRVEKSAGPSFSERVEACARQFLAVHGPTSGERLTIHCKQAGILPKNDDRSFGPVYMRMARQGIIHKVGGARRERGHGTSGGNIWALASP